MVSPHRLSWRLGSVSSAGRAHLVAISNRYGLTRRAVKETVFLERHPWNHKHQSWCESAAVRSAPSRWVHEFGEARGPENPRPSKVRAALAGALAHAATHDTPRPQNSILAR